MDYKKVFAMKREREKKIASVCPTITNNSGIYVFYRNDETGLKMCYCGQARHLKERCASHLAEYDHIGLSLKKRGFYSEENPYGWKLIAKECAEDKLDENEKLTITHFGNNGYQLYNVTAGGQGKGKRNIAEGKSNKGYRDGLIQGRKNASREIANLFEKHLVVSKKSEKPNKIQEKALAKFNEFLEFHKAESEG